MQERYGRIIRRKRNGPIEQDLSHNLRILSGLVDDIGNVLVHIDPHEGVQCPIKRRHPNFGSSGASFFDQITGQSIHQSGLAGRVVMNLPDHFRQKDLAGCLDMLFQKIAGFIEGKIRNVDLIGNVERTGRILQDSGDVGHSHQHNTAQTDLSAVMVDVPDAVQKGVQCFDIFEPFDLINDEDDFLFHGRGQSMKKIR